MNSVFFPSIRFAIVGSAFICLGWLIICHFQSPTADFDVMFREGLPALAEQVTLGAVAPAYVLREIAVVSIPQLNRMENKIKDSTLPLIIPLLFLQYWPAFLLCVVPWRRLKVLMRRIIVIYSGLLMIVISVASIWLRHNWDSLFFAG